jgi:hypothetical protein
MSPTNLMFIDFLGLSIALCSLAALAVPSNQRLKALEGVAEHKNIDNREDNRETETDNANEDAENAGNGAGGGK